MKYLCPRDFRRGKMEEKMKKVGLILEGGANRGIFTSGVIDCLNTYKIEFEYVLAVSVGTCNAIDFLSKQIGRTKSCMIPKGRNIPPIHWRNIFIDKSPINLDLVFNKYPNELVRFDYNSFFSSNTIAEFVVTNCRTGEAEYLSEKSDGKRLMNICKASCSMPYLCQMTGIEDDLYLDGGITDAIPILHAIKMGYERNVVVLTRDGFYEKKDSKLLRVLSRIYYRDYPELIKALDHRIEKYNESIQLIRKLELQKKIMVIRPSEVLVNRMTNNQDKLEKFYNEGYEITNNLIDNIKKFVNQ